MQSTSIFILALTEDPVADHTIISILAVLFMILASIWLLLKDYQSRKWEKGIFPLDTELNKMNLAKAYAVSSIYMIQRDNREIPEKISYLQSYHTQHFKDVDLDIKARIKWSFDYPISPTSVAKWMNHANVSEEEKLKYITFLIDLCFIDGAVIRAEYFIISSIGKSFDLNANFIEKTLADRQPRDEFKKEISNDQRSLLEKALLILDLKKGTTQDDIKKRYRKLAKKFHPDKNTNKSETEKMILMAKFIKITEAYEYLSNIQN